MKKTIYKLFVLFALVIFGCTTDSVEQHETAAEIAKEKVLETTKATSEDTPKNTKTSTSNSSRTNTANNNSSQQTGRKGFGDGDGNIYDGTNDTGAEPNGGDLYVFLVQYHPGLTATDKNNIRVKYQVSDDLVFFEQCTTDPDKELWHMNPVVTYGCSAPEGYVCSRTDNPPIEDPDELREVWYQTHCN